MNRFADAETGTGFTPGREAVRDRSTSFALLTSFTMTERAVVVKAIAGHHTSLNLNRSLAVAMRTTAAD
jgi:hypothetical protein